MEACIAYGSRVGSCGRTRSGLLCRALLKVERLRTLVVKIGVCEHSLQHGNDGGLEVEVV